MVKRWTGSVLGDSICYNFTAANKGQVYWNSVILEWVIQINSSLSSGFYSIHQIILILLFDEIMTLAGKGNNTDVKSLGFAGI